MDPDHVAGKSMMWISILNLCIRYSKSSVAFDSLQCEKKKQPLIYFTVFVNITPELIRFWTLYSSYVVMLVRSNELMWRFRDVCAIVAPVREALLSFKNSVFNVFDKFLVFFIPNVMPTCQCAKKWVVTIGDDMTADK